MPESTENGIFSAMYDYYQNLSPSLKSVYRSSDRVQSVPRLPEAGNLCLLSIALRDDLKSGNKAAVTARVRFLANGLARCFAIQTPLVKVLNKRPVRSQSEYYGLYEAADDGSPPVIKLWMYTSQRQKVVAYKTFLRTFVHEFCHHLDYEWLRLSDSLHTEGFFKRESSLFKQLVAAD